MALYTYQATKQNGEIVFGEKDVSSYDELATELNKENLMVISIEKKVDVNIGSFFDKMKDFEIGDIPLEEKVVFSRQLATMLSAGLPITQAIEILLQQTKYSRMRNKLAMVYKDIQAGSTLAYSFGKADLIFNELQLSLIEAGEASGNLVEIMQQIADDMKKSASLQGKIKGAILDVFKQEPLPRKHNLWKLNNIIVTPHIAGNINLFRDEIMRDFIYKVKKWSLRIS